MGTFPQLFINFVFLKKSARGVILCLPFPCFTVSKIQIDTIYKQAAIYYYFTRETVFTKLLLAVLTIVIAAQLKTVN